MNVKFCWFESYYQFLFKSLFCLYRKKNVMKWNKMKWEIEMLESISMLWMSKQQKKVVKGNLMIWRFRLIWI